MSKYVQSMKKKRKITAAKANAFNILGTYAGEVLDTNITNMNGLDITREVMEVVFQSEDYERGIENGWFIGFLGHPDDPNCMEFERGCIVMTEGHIDENGKVYGEFNLIDTPVGRIVKTFQDAGVTFGISIRGAGDIVNNSVEPNTFVFRGFDLVSFPAYPESIPTFTEIAASTNLEDRKKYQAVCAAVSDNLDSITSCSTIDVLQAQFAPQSDVYKSLEKQREKILSKKTFNIDNEKIEAMTSLYLEASANVNELAEQVETLKLDKAKTISACNRKVASIKRITESQISDLSKSLDSVTASRDSLIQRNRTLVTSCSELRSQNARLAEDVKSAQKTNLLYKQRITASEETLQQKDSVIVGLKRNLRKTVTANSKVESETSNLGEENRMLKAEIRACKEALRAYQSAYANIYANALGVNPDSVIFSEKTSVTELQQIISGATNTANIPSTVTVEPLYVDDTDDNEIISI